MINLTNLPNETPYQLFQEYYKKALELDPEHLGAIEYQGEMYVDLGQKENALNNLALLKKLVGENNSYYKELNNYISNN